MNETSFCCSVVLWYSQIWYWQQVWCMLLGELRSSFLDDQSLHTFFFDLSHSFIGAIPFWSLHFLLLPLLMYICSSVMQALESSTEMLLNSFCGCFHCIREILKNGLNTFPEWFWRLTTYKISVLKCLTDIQCKTSKATASQNWQVHWQLL